MTPELTILVGAVALTFVQMLIAASGATLQVGLPTLAGNREGLSEPTGWAGRAHRAYRNMLEGMLLFVPLVLIAVLADRTNETTLLGAHLFIWARVVHALVYLAGIPWVRTGVWLVSVVGLLLIFLQLI